MLSCLTAQDEHIDTNALKNREMVYSSVTAMSPLTDIYCELLFIPDML